jgi:hypothetical protein
MAGCGPPIQIGYHNLGLTTPSETSVLTYDPDTGEWSWEPVGGGTTDPELLALAALVSAADSLPYFTGSGTAALATFTGFARTLVDDPDATTARGTLGLGSAATHPTTDFLQPANNLSDVGSAPTARTNLGLGSVSTLASDTDTTLAADSNAKVATQHAVKAYVDAAVAGLLDLKGGTDCSANPNYPAASKGDAYYVTVAGKIGGAAGKSVDVGDVYFANADNAGGTEASVGTSWNVLEHNLAGALVAANNLSDLTNTTTARTNLGLGSSATHAVGDFAQTANNLSDLASVPTARTNLGLGSLATQSGTFSGTHSGTSSGTNTGDQTITLTGDVTGSGTGSFATTLANSGVGAGTYTSVTVDAKGRVTAGTNPGGSLDIHGLTAAEPALSDEVPEYNTAATANRKVTWQKVLGLTRVMPGGRLTGISGSPVTASDTLTINTLYYTPYVHDLLPLWDGSRWNLHQFSEISLSLAGIASFPFDIFVYNNSGTLTLEMAAWTSAIARATAITVQDGRYCKSGDKTRLYLGTIEPVGTGATEDSAARRFIWNMYNRVSKHMKAVDTTNSWTYTTATYRSANGSTANRVQFVRGLDEDSMEAEVHGYADNASIVSAATGIGLDSTSANSATVFGGAAASNPQTIDARWRGFPGIGFHFLQWLEISGAAGTTTWYGDNGGTIVQTGIVATGLF